MARIRVELIGFDGLDVRVRNLLRAGEDLSPAMRDIGEALVNSTRDCFRSQAAPDGSRWAPLSPTKLARKRRNRDKVLTERGYLRGSIAVGDVTRDSVEVGTGRVYGATHQFGARKGQCWRR